MTANSFMPKTLAERLTNGAETADRLLDWPIESWDALRDAGALGWSIPQKFGGQGCDPVTLLQGTEAIARCCLTTAFALSQREAAVRQLLKGPASLQERYLSALARGESFLTVGLSQLSTSRQHQGPALRATPLAEGGFLLNGEIPWVTGADRAAAIVIGASVIHNDAITGQLLVVIPAERLAGMIEPPMQLAALVGSRTSLIHCDNVRIHPEDVLAGPTDSVMGKIGGGGLETSCLAIGLASAAIEFLHGESRTRPELTEFAATFDERLRSCRSRLHELAGQTVEPEVLLGLRTDCTLLALRATQATLLNAKGAGFIAPHPAQRWARQALFFLVWSCPRPVTNGVLADLANW